MNAAYLPIYLSVYMQLPTAARWSSMDLALGPMLWLLRPKLALESLQPRAMGTTELYQFSLVHGQTMRPVEKPWNA